LTRAKSTLKTYSRRGNEITLTSVNPGYAARTYHAGRITIHHYSECNRRLFINDLRWYTVVQALIRTFAAEMGLAGYFKR